jgi:hypothetical protein
MEDDLAAVVDKDCRVEWFDLSALKERRHDRKAIVARRLSKSVEVGTVEWDCCVDPTPPGHGIFRKQSDCTRLKTSPEIR